MRKLIAAFKVSLDMKFQGPGDYADWVSGWSDDYDLSDEIDACIMGGAMYRGYERYWSAMRDAPEEPSPMTGAVPTPRELEWCARIPDLPHYVLTRTMQETAWPNTRFLRDRGEISELKALPGKNIYLMGGGRLLRDMIAAGQVDELRLIVYPVIAGGPNALFGVSDQRRAAELTATRSLPGGLLRADYRIVS